MTHLVITCKRCNEAIECPATQDGQYDMGPIRAHHRVTGHKVDGTDFVIAA